MAAGAAPKPTPGRKRRSLLGDTDDSEKHGGPPALPQLERISPPSPGFAPVPRPSPQPSTPLSVYSLPPSPEEPKPVNESGLKLSAWDRKTIKEVYGHAIADLSPSELHEMDTEALVDIWCYIARIKGNLPDSFRYGDPRSMKHADLIDGPDRPTASKPERSRTGSFLTSAEEEDPIESPSPLFLPEPRIRTRSRTRTPAPREVRSIDTQTPVEPRKKTRDEASSAVPDSQPVSLQTDPMEVDEAGNQTDPPSLADASVQVAEPDLLPWLANSLLASRFLLERELHSSAVRSAEVGDAEKGRLRSDLAGASARLAAATNSLSRAKSTTSGVPALNARIAELESSLASSAAVQERLRQSIAANARFLQQRRSLQEEVQRLASLVRGLCGSKENPAELASRLAKSERAAAGLRAELQRAREAMQGLMGMHKEAVEALGEAARMLRRIGRGEANDVAGLAEQVAETGAKAEVDRLREELERCKKERDAAKARAIEAEAEAEGLSRVLESAEGGKRKREDGEEMREAWTKVMKVLDV
ncbi:hypothetical protein DFJ74DRAFT_703240 [Hyaloraphidium curvatum]|nr:hypothetical protein DFJ74DRAFT_703240 [Hyaloraphidium curvatum]